MLIQHSKHLIIKTRRKICRWTKLQNLMAWQLPQERINRLLILVAHLTQATSRAFLLRKIRRSKSYRKCQSRAQGRISEQPKQSLTNQQSRDRLVELCALSTRSTRKEAHHGRHFARTIVQETHTVQLLSTWLKIMTTSTSYNKSSTHKISQVAAKLVTTSFTNGIRTQVCPNRVTLGSSSLRFPQFDPAVT